MMTLAMQWFSRRLRRVSPQLLVLILLPALIIVAVPQFRDLLRFQLQGRSQIQNGGMLRLTREVYPFELEGAGWLHPEVKKPLAVRVWQLWQEENHGLATRGHEVVVQRLAARIIGEYPQEKWLHTVRLWCAMSSGPNYSNGVEVGVPLRKRLALAHTVGHLEPGNAFPLVCEAAWRVEKLRSPRGRPGQTASTEKESILIEELLARAYGADYYDERQLEVISCLISAGKLAGPLIYEDKMALVAEQGYAYWALEQLSQWLVQRRHERLERGDTEIALRLGLHQAGVGHLLMTGRNNADARTVGWQLMEASLHLPAPAGAARSASSGNGGSGGKRLGGKPLRSRADAMEVYQRLAAGVGRDEWAERMQHLQEQKRLLRLFEAQHNSFEQDLNLHSNPLHPALGRELGTVLLLLGGYILVCWGAVSVLCLGTHRQGVQYGMAPLTIAAGCSALCVGACAVGWSLFWHRPEDLEWRSVQEATIGTGVLLVLGTPVWAWLLATYLGWKKADPVRPLTAEMPGKLSPWQTHVLRHGPRYLALLTFGSLALSVLIAVPSYIWNWDGGIFLDWVPSPNPAYNLREALAPRNLVLPGYLLLLSLLVLFCWIARWRWFMPLSARPATHSGLRLWRDSLGYFLLLLLWSYLAVALFYAPGRQNREGLVEDVLARGEVGALFLATPGTVPGAGVAAAD